MVLAVTTVASYALGLLRDRQFAHVFGASHALDAYNQAFAIPDLILNIFVAGALTAAFIPLFSSASEEERPEFVNSVLNSSLLIVIFCGLLSFIFAPQLSHLVAPDFDPQARVYFINLLRMLLLSPVIFAVSNTFGSILVSRNRFFWYGISASFYNLGIILGTLFLAPKFGIYGAAIGTLAGALLHLIPRLAAVWRWLSYKPYIKLPNTYKNFVRLMIPRMAGHPIEQLTFVGFNAIATTLGVGAIPGLSFPKKF